MQAFVEMPNLKLAVVVDDNMDVFNECEVLWAVGTRTHWDMDLEVLRNAQSFRGWSGDAVAMIDATRPLEGHLPKRNEIPQDALDRIDVSKYTMGEQMKDRLKLTEVWFKLILLVFFVFLYVLSIPYPEKSKQFPQLLSLFALIMIVISLVIDFTKKGAVAEGIAEEKFDQNIIIAVFMTIIIYISFQWFMKVPLLTGILWEIS